jgi:hypothetical protein
MGRLGIYDRQPMVCEEETREEVAAAITLTAAATSFFTDWNHYG